jgi:hypothetical protein
MRVLAYGRRVRSSSAADQIARAEAWAGSRGHEVVRLAGYTLAPRSTEFPPRADVLEACRGRIVDGVVLVDLAGFGPDVAGVLSELERSGAAVLVVGHERARPMDLGTPELAIACEVAHALDRARRLRPDAPRRVCPPRVKIDLDEVRTRVADGARLEDVALRVGCSRSTIVRRLRRHRDESR